MDHDEDLFSQQALFAALPCPAYTKDREGRFVSCNKAFCAALGVVATDIIGRTASECWLQPEADLHARYDRLCLESAKPQRYRTRVRGPNGQQLYADISKDVLRDGQGQVIGLVGCMVDISEQQEVEQHLREREEDLRTTLDSIGDGVITSDVEGRIRDMNPQAERLCGWRAAEAVGRPAMEILQLIDPRSRQPVEDPVGLVLSTGSMVALPPFATLVARDGSERRIADRGSPIRDAQGRVVGAVLVFRDITEQNMLRQQLRHARKLDSVGKIAGGVVHDVNNLLSGVLGAAELMEERLDGDPETGKYARMIIDSIEQVGELTGRILRFSRKDDEATVMEPLEMHAVLRDASAMLERSLERSVRLDLRLAAALSTVRGDRSSLQSAIINLGVNARDAMPDGGRLSIVSSDMVIDEDLAIDLRMRAGPALCIEVADSGGGIDPDVLPYVFEPFFTTKPPGAGTGLGLPSVAATLREHGGAVSIESDADGTTVRCFIPQEHSLRIDTPPPIITGRRILVVDDEEISRKALCIMLKEMDCQVAEASSAEQACDLARASDFDLVILDVIMPGGDGIACFRSLRAIDPGIRVVMYSGCAKLSAIDTLFDEGLLAFLRKPIDYADLQRCIGEFVGCEQ